MLEAKTLLTVLAYMLGIPVYVLGILANIESWKAGVLFILALVLGCLRIYFYFVRQQQLAREREIDLERRRWQLDKEKRAA